MQGTRPPASWFLVLVTIVAGVTATLAVAFLTGDQSPSSELDDYDRAVQPIDLSPTVAKVIGVASMVVTVGAIALVMRRTRSGASASAWRLAVLALVSAGGLVGLAYGTGTEKVIGANIGHGVVVLAAVPLVPAALIVGTLAMARGCRMNRESLRTPVDG